MQHLSGSDNLFLEMEDSRQHMHIASLAIYDPSTAAGGQVRFKTILDFFSGKINELALFRRRLVKAPFKLDRPYWVDDGEIDVEYHVRHIALPHPGDWRQLMIQVARIHARPLDLSRPLWEAYVIGGLDNIEGIAKGSFALYIKFHHSTMDGQAGAKLIELMHSISPEYEATTSNSVIYADREPNDLELILRGLGNRGKQAADTAKLSIELTSKVIGLGAKHLPKMLSDSSIGVSGTLKKFKQTLSGPKTRNRFNGKVSPHRVVDAIGLDFKSCKVIRENIEGITINDIFMATASGGVRKYLSHHNELNDEGIKALMPLAATGAQHNKDSGNNISMAVVAIHSNIEDPLERLLAIKASSGDTKELQEDLGRDLIAKLNNVVSPSLTKRLNAMTLQNKASLTLSNVRGPNIPLYLAGAKLQMFIPVSIPMDGLGLNITGFSYNNVLWVCTTACREMVPDPDFFSTCLKDSFKELIDTAKKIGEDNQKKVVSIAKSETKKSATEGDVKAKSAGRKKPAVKAKKASIKKPKPKMSTPKKPTLEKKEESVIEEPVTTDAFAVVQEPNEPQSTGPQDAQLSANGLTAKELGTKDNFKLA